MASIIRKFAPLQHHAERGDIADESPPTIDLRGGRADAVDEEMVREVATACAEWGFFNGTWSPCTAHERVRVSRRSSSKAMNTRLT